MFKDLEKYCSRCKRNTPHFGGSGVLNRGKWAYFCRFCKTEFVVEKEEKKEKVKPKQRISLPKTDIFSLFLNFK